MDENKVIYPELSYKIVGCIFNVYNTLGANHREYLYQKALAKEFDINKIKYISQVPCNLIYKDSVIGKYYLDFLIDDKIVLELKAGPHFKKNDFDQILDYLKTTHHKLGILANFGSETVSFRRILNI